MIQRPGINKLKQFIKNCQDSEIVKLLENPQYQELVDTTDIMKYIAKNKKLDLFKDILNICSLNIDNYAFHFVYEDFLEGFVYLVENKGISKSEYFNVSIIQNKYSIFEYIIKDTDIVFDWQHCITAIMVGNKKMYDFFLFDVGVILPDPVIENIRTGIQYKSYNYCLYSEKERKSLDLIKRPDIRRVLKRETLHKYIKKASRIGRADVVKCIIEDSRLEKDKYYNYCIKWAGKNNHQEVLDILLSSWHN